MSKGDQKSALAEFDNVEKRKEKAERSRIEAAYEDAIETLKRQIVAESDDVVR